MPTIAIKALRQTVENVVVPITIAVIAAYATIKAAQATKEAK